MAHHYRPSVSRRVRSESGSIIILTALSMVVLLGIAAFAIDGSFLYTERNRIAAAADAAAKSAAIELKRRPLISDTDLTTFARHEVTVQGFDNTTSVTARHPPDGTSSFSGNPGMVQVKVSRPTNTFFASVLNGAWGSVSPLVSAVAGASAPGNCIVANGDIDLKNNTTLLNGCSMAVGGNLTTGGGIGGTPPPSVVVAGSCTGPCGNVTSGPKPSDPLSGLVAPTVTGVGCPAGIPAVLNPLPSGCYTSIPASITTLATGGSFKVSGPITITGTLTGTNVLLYLTSTGSIVPKNNSRLTITAQTTGTYQGIVVYGDAGSAIDGSTTNAFALDAGGAIYMPGGNIDMKNGFDVNPIGNCLLIVVNNYSAKNNNFAATTSGCYSAFGGAAFLGVALAE